MSFTPTEEQVAIIAAARDTSDNLAVIARAGAAKTTTLVMIAEALPAVDILCLAFNKKIAEEMTERLPKNCEAKTLHSLGYSAWRQFVRGKSKLMDSKCFGLLKSRIETLDPEDRTAAYESMSETLDILRTAKSDGYLPEEFTGHWKPLIGNRDFFDGLPMEPSLLQEQLVNAVLIDSFKLALEGALDSDDMIYCPALCSVSWPAPKLTLIDEAQDLSPINHHILKKIVKSRRIIAVGDPCQAIYGFRGALEKSMESLIQMFSMHELKLTISFRCGSKICENARWRAPDMRSPDWAVPGEVKRLITWDASQIEMGDAIICRNNAPLFSMAIQLIEADLLPEIAGRDLAGPLTKIMNKLGKPLMPRADAIASLERWKDKELARARSGAKGQVHDKALCIQIMLQKTKTLGDAVAYLAHLLTRDGRIHLMTGHKAKGLEFERVWFLDQHLCDIKRGQDANVKYVIETRAKDFLAYVTLDSFAANEVDMA